MVALVADWPAEAQQTMAVADEAEAIEREEDQVPPDDEHEHVDVPRVLQPNTRHSESDKSDSWSWESLFFKANCATTKSTFCAMHAEDLWRKSSNAAPLPSVAVEGPADLPKSQAVAMLPLKKKRPSCASSGTISVSETMSDKSKVQTEKNKEDNGAFEQEVASALSKVGYTGKAPAALEGRRIQSPKNHRTLKFYPQPADDRSATLVDVIEHGYEVLIVRREPSPTPKCPSDMLQTPRSNHSGELLIPVGASPVTGDEKEEASNSDASL